MPRKKASKKSNNAQKDLTIHPYRSGLSFDQLLEMRRRLAKRANQRMRRLENTTSKVTGESFGTYGAIELVRDYLKSHGRAANGRFSENKRPFVGGAIKDGLMDSNQLISEIFALQSFLRSKSSTVKGQREIERQRINTFESGAWGKRYRITGDLNRPIKFSSNKEFYDFLNSAEYKELLTMGFTSEQLIESYDEAAEDIPPEEIINAMQQALDTFRQSQNPNWKELQSILKNRSVIQ